MTDPFLGVFRKLVGSRTVFIPVKLLHLYLSGVAESERKLIIVNTQFHGVSHWRVLLKSYKNTGYNTHIKEMLTERTRSANRNNPCSFTDTKLFKCHKKQSP